MVQLQHMFIDDMQYLIGPWYMAPPKFYTILVGDVSPDQSHLLMYSLL